MRVYMDSRVTPHRRVTSPARGPPPPCKQALRQNLRGGISHKRPEMYNLSYKLALFPKAGVKVRQNLGGGISPRRPELLNIFK